MSDLAFYLGLLYSFLHLVFLLHILSHYVCVCVGRGGLFSFLDLVPYEVVCLYVDILEMIKKQVLSLNMCTSLLGVSPFHSLDGIFWWVFTLSSLSISHLQALLLFLTTFCLQRYYEDALPHCLLDDCHLTLRVYRTGIISMSHKECIGFTYSCACPDAELTRTFASPPPVTVWPLLSLHCHASVCWWTLALLVYLTCMFLAHITFI